MPGGPACAASRIGVDLEEYLRRREHGERWCGVARHWVPAETIVGTSGRCRRCHGLRNAASRYGRLRRDEFDAAVARAPSPRDAPLAHVRAVLQAGRGTDQTFGIAWTAATARLPEEWRAPVDATRGAWARAYAREEPTPAERAAGRVLGGLDALDDHERGAREPAVVAGVHTTNAGRPAGVPFVRRT